MQNSYPERFKNNTKVLMQTCKNVFALMNVTNMCAVCSKAD